MKRTGWGTFMMTSRDSVRIFRIAQCQATIAPQSCATSIVSRAPEAAISASTSATRWSMS